MAGTRTGSDNKLVSVRYAWQVGNIVDPAILAIEAEATASLDVEYATAYQGQIATLKAQLEQERARVATLVDALESYREAVLDYSPREDHDWRCEIRTADAGWKPGDPPVIDCECGFDELGRATAKVGDTLSNLSQAASDHDAREQAKGAAAERERLRPFMAIAPEHIARAERFERGKTLPEDTGDVAATDRLLLIRTLQRVFAETYKPLEPPTHVKGAPSA